MDAGVVERPVQARVDCATCEHYLANSPPTAGARYGEAITDA